MDIHPKKCTVTGQPPDPNYKGGAPQDINPSTGQHRDHYILCDAERAKGFVKPVRCSYIHIVCGAETHMPLKIAETYAREPGFYGSTFCCTCRNYFELLKDGVRQFKWVGGDGEGVGEA